MKKIILFFILIIANSFFLFAQPSIQWQKCLGGSGDDLANTIQQTTDGGYIVAGWTNSNDNDVSGNHGSYDYWVVKLNSVGTIEWQKSLGGTGTEEASSIQQTTDSGYIVAGVSDSNDSNITGNHGGSDYWVVKLNSSGAIQWQKCLGGMGNEEAQSVQQTRDSGYIVAGNSYSNDSDVTGNHGGWDYWVVKLNSLGTIQWQKSLGGTGDDWANSIQQTTDGGYIVAGYSNSNDSNVSGNHGVQDYWIVKLNSSGTIEWQKSLGGTGGDYAYSIQQTTDSSYIVAGYSSSNDGDVTGNHGGYDCWIAKLHNTGTIQWQKCLGGTWFDYAYSIQQTTDSGYIVAGHSESNDSDVSGNHGGGDHWIVKLNTTGIIQWQKCLGGTGYDEAYSIQQTRDSGYIVAGYSSSNDGDVTGNHGGGDYWVVKLAPIITGIEEITNPISNLQIIPNPFSTQTTLSFQLSTPNKVLIEIRDLEGRIIKNLNPKNLSIGMNEVVWDATDDSGSKVDAGVYFVTIMTGDVNETRKVVVLKN